MVKRFKEDLTTCQQLQEYENIRAEKNVEEPDTDKNNTKDKK